MLNALEIDAGGNDGVGVDDTMIRKELFLHVESCRWCVGLPAMAYTNQKAVSSYILL